ncbi:uncharacterized protein F4822DRAFT_302239 [Hypoxylon trugodes]|uniref:uncharacterized protein n=1 Tax=Hypoxylon trugodes TaxID=326681 RepID=UPI00219362D0|nr:uncharacterized protein F4822DRAFT_302239 [Hypoxylon trugodes]KAI1388101.1 hypothetical protein F4822DRAFT_302239 [Hypoxylon trugodes]
MKVRGSREAPWRVIKKLESTEISRIAESSAVPATNPGLDIHPNSAGPQIQEINRKRKRDYSPPLRLTGSTSTTAPVPQRHPHILYRLTCHSANFVPIHLYSWNRFKGLEQDDHELQERRNLAVLDIIDTVDGDHITNPPRKNQLRDNFLQDDPNEFILDVDFRVRKIYRTCLRIHSPHVQYVLRTLIRYYPGFNVQENEIFCIYPFAEIFHYWSDLQRVKGDLLGGCGEVNVRNPDIGSEVIIKNSPLLCEHLCTLLDAPPIQNVYGNIVGPELNLHSKDLATYDLLWLLFKPGEIVFMRIMNKLSGFVVMNITYEPKDGESVSPLSNQDPSDRWKITLWNLGYKNKMLRRQSFYTAINRFYGEKLISDLIVFPIKSTPSYETLKGQLIERGKRYYSLICSEQSHMRYDGMVVGENPHHYEGEIIVDHQGFQHEVPVEASTYCEPEDLGGEPLFSKFNDMKCSPEIELEPAQYLLLPTYVLGFAVGKRE